MSPTEREAPTLGPLFPSPPVTKFGSSMSPPGLLCPLVQCLSISRDLHQGFFLKHTASIEPTLLRAASVRPRDVMGRRPYPSLLKTCWLSHVPEPSMLKCLGHSPSSCARPPSSNACCVDSVIPCLGSDPWLVTFPWTGTSHSCS